MWGVCGWSALLVKCVFTSHFDTIGGVNIGVNRMVTHSRCSRKPISASFSLPHADSS